MVYTHVREDVLDEAREALVFPWVEMVSRRPQGRGRRLRVYVQTVWHRPVLTRIGTIQGVEAGDKEGGPTLIYDSGA